MSQQLQVSYTYVHTYALIIGLGDTENVPCDNCNKRQCNYCSEIFTIMKDK